jgi:hypothetical protein
MNSHLTQDWVGRYDIVVNEGKEKKVYRSDVLLEKCWIGREEKRHVPSRTP